MRERPGGAARGLKVWLMVGGGAGAQLQRCRHPLRRRPGIAGAAPGLPVAGGDWLQPATVVAEAALLPRWQP